MLAELHIRCTSLLFARAGGTHAACKHVEIMPVGGSGGITWEDLLNRPKKVETVAALLLGTKFPLCLGSRIAVRVAKGRAAVNAKDCIPEVSASS